MAEDIATIDSFSAAKANVRETVKWLTAALAGIAVIVVGASPFVDLGSLESWRLYSALACAIIGLASIIGAILLSLRLLVMPPFFFSDIKKNEQITKFIDSHAEDFLPVGMRSFQEFANERDRTLQALRAAKTDADAAPHQAKQAVIEKIISRLLSVCAYEALRQRFDQTKVKLFSLSVFGIAALTAFAFIANPPKASSAPTLQVTCQTAK